MTKHTPPPRTSTEAPPTEAVLGPAVVVESGRILRVRMDDGGGLRQATPAFTFPFEPQVGDRLLVLAQGTSCYAVGVLAGQRPASLTLPGHAEIRTQQGKLTLASDQAIELQAPRVTIRAGVLRTIADRVVEKAGNVRRWIRDTLSIRAGTSRRTIDGEDSTRCQNSTTLAKDTVKIDGDQLHLGH